MPRTICLSLSYICISQLLASSLWDRPYFNFDCLSIRLFFDGTNLRSSGHPCTLEAPDFSFALIRGGISDAYPSSRPRFEPGPFSWTMCHQYVEPNYRV